MYFFYINLSNESINTFVIENYDFLYFVKTGNNNLPDIPEDDFFCLLFLLIIILYFLYLYYII